MLNFGIRRRNRPEGAGGRGLSPGVVVGLAAAGLAAFGGLILVTIGTAEGDAILGILLIAAAIVGGAFAVAFEERRGIKRAIAQSRNAETRPETRDRARPRAP